MLQQIQGFPCGTCGGSFTAGGGYEDNGQFICKRCYDQRAALAESAQSATDQAAFAQQAVQAPRRAAVPAYNGIVNGAKLLQGYALWLTLLAVLSILLGIFLAVEAVLQGAKEKLDATIAFSSAAVLLVGGIMVAVGLLISATLVRMLAELALAQRDIARNSFR